MQTPNFIVRIPEPCHEDWNNMQPDAKGKFCNSCSKSVFDFSNKTDSEIKDILLEYKDQKVCGHFKKSQVNRPLNISINLRDLPKNISISKAFGIALFLVFGTFLFSCTDNHGQKVNEIEVIDSQKEMTLGSLAIDPPPAVEGNIDLTEVLSGDTMIEMDSIQTISYTETHVDGGISFEEVPYENVVPVKEDTIIKEETVIEPMMVGQMLVYMPPDTATVVTQDTTPNDDAKRVVKADVITKTPGFGIYPNPGNGEFTIKYDVVKRSDVRVEVYGMNGVLIRTVVNINNQYEGHYQIPVNLSELPNGIYLVSLINNGKKSVERLVIER